MARSSGKEGNSPLVLVYYPNDIDAAVFSQLFSEEGFGPNIRYVKGDATYARQDIRFGLNDEEGTIEKAGIMIVGMRRAEKDPRVADVIMESAKIIKGPTILIAEDARQKLLANRLVMAIKSPELRKKVVVALGIYDIETQSLLERLVGREEWTRKWEKKFLIFRNKVI